MRKRKVPTVVTVDDAILRYFLNANVHTKTLPGKRVLLVDEAAGQICLPAGNINWKQQLQGSGNEKAHMCADSSILTKDYTASVRPTMQHASTT